MNLPRWIWTGLAACLAGMAIWVAVGYFTKTEASFVAWGIGMLVGAGVRYGAFTEDKDESLFQGLFAAATAFGSILLAKYVLFTILVSAHQKPGLEAHLAMITTDEAMIAPMAELIAEEMKAQGKKLKWPEKSSVVTAPKEADYPVVVWKEAKKRWDALPEASRQAARDKRRQEAVAFVKSLGPSFAVMFSPFDVVWFALATITAYKIGVGSYESDD